MFHLTTLPMLPLTTTIFESITVRDFLLDPALGFA